MTSADEPTVEGDRTKARADALLSEEEEAGSDDPLAQAEAILEESDEREVDRVDPPGQGVEHRRSEDTVDDRSSPEAVSRRTRRAAARCRRGSARRSAAGTPENAFRMVRHECGQSDDTCG